MNSQKERHTVDGSEICKNQFILRISPCFHRISFITSEFCWISEPSINPEPFFCESKSLPPKNSPPHQRHPLKSLLTADLSRSSRRCSLHCQTVFWELISVFLDEIPIGPNHRFGCFLLKPLVNHGMDFKDRSLNC